MLNYLPKIPFNFVVLHEFKNVTNYAVYPRFRNYIKNQIPAYLTPLCLELVCSSYKLQGTMEQNWCGHYSKSNFYHILTGTEI